MDITIFYSWQNDLPNATNRRFIQKALEKAAKVIQLDESIYVEPRVDQATQDVPGSPDIAQTILDKIEQSEIFVCDVSIINPTRSPQCRPTPNPNVLIELGFAIKTLGWERVIMVNNSAYGRPEQLPFDLRGRRIFSYHMLKESTSRAPERNVLQTRLETELRQILDAGLRLSPAPSLTSHVDLSARLAHYNLDNIKDSGFGENLLTENLVTVQRDSSDIKRFSPTSSTIFLAIPSTPIEQNAGLIFETARKLSNQWVVPGSTGPRYFSSRVFPLSNSIMRIEQKAVVFENKDLGIEGNFWVLRINELGEVSFATSYYTVEQRAGQRVFQLGALAHLFWSFLCLVREFYDTVGYKGYSHACIAMTDTQKTFLGHFVQGERDALSPNNIGWVDWPRQTPEICQDPNLLICRENINLSLFENKIVPQVIYAMADEIARAFNQFEARCFDRENRKLPEYLWPREL